MTFLKFSISLLFVVMFQTACLAQESGGSKPDVPKKDQSLKSKRKQRKADKKEWKEERRKKRAEEKKIKNHHKRIQTKETRKRMKRSSKRAEMNRDHKREPFFQRLFNHSGKAKRHKQPKEKTTKVS